MTTPIGITQDTTSITRNTAAINGKISDDGGETCEARFRYRKYVETPAAITGQLYITKYPIAEYGNTTAFVWWNAPYVVTLHVESASGSKDLVIPGDPHNDFIYAGYTGVLTDDTTLYLSYNDTTVGKIVVNKYNIGASSLTLLSTNYLEGGTSQGGFIRLASGRLVLAYHAFALVGGQKMVYFAYTDSAGTWHTLAPQGFTGTNTGLYSYLCQHPDGTIWYFCDNDSITAIKALKLTEDNDADNISVTWKNESFITTANVDIEPDGEKPYIQAVASASDNSIILSYQRKKARGGTGIGYLRFYAMPVFVKIASDETVTYLFYSNKYTMRTNPFKIGLNEDRETWIACGKADTVADSDYELYLGDTDLGTMPTDWGSHVFTYSSKFLIYPLNDGKIYHYPLSYYEGAKANEVTPTGYVDADTQWTDEDHIYDEDTNTFASGAALADTWSSWVELTHSAVSCNGLWFYHVTAVPAYTGHQFDVYYDSDWHNVYDGIPNTGWVYIDVSDTPVSITAIRYRAKRSTDGGIALVEIDFESRTAVGANWTETAWAGTLTTDSIYHEDLTGLAYTTEYEFQTQAQNSIEGVWSASAYFTTLVGYCILLETGDILLMETGDALLIEGSSRTNYEGFPYAWPIIFYEYCKSLSGSITPTGSLVKKTLKKLLAGSITPTGTLTHVIKIILSGSITPTGLLIKKTLKPLSGSITPTGALVKKTFKKLLAGSMTPTGVLAVAKTVIKLVGLIEGVATVSGTVSLNAILNLVGLIQGAATAIGNASILKTLQSTVAGSAGVTGMIAILKTLAGIVTGASSTWASLSTVGGVIIEYLAGISAGVASVLGTLYSPISVRFTMYFRNRSISVRTRARSLVMKLRKRY